jgi:hypothetical protein
MHPALASPGNVNFLPADSCCSLRASVAPTEASEERRPECFGHIGPMHGSGKRMAEMQEIRPIYGSASTIPPNGAGGFRDGRTCPFTKKHG